MKKLFVLLAAVLAVVAHAEEQFIGLYMQGNKIGYSSYTTHPETLGERTVSRTDSKMVMNTALLGSALTMSTESTTWSDSAGRPIKMLFMMTSSGRTQKITADFKASIVEIDIDNSGQKSHK